MAVDMFLKIDGIEGESTDSDHGGEIDVLSYSFGVSNSGTMSVMGGGGAGKSSFQDLSFTIYQCKASTKLFNACSTGKHIPKAVLTVRKAGTKQQEYVKVTLTDLLVSSFQSGNSSGQEMAHETFTLNFSKIKYEYAPQKQDGTLDAYQQATYDVKANKAS